MSEYVHHVGLAGLMRDWLEKTDLNDVIHVLRRCCLPVNGIPAGRDPGNLAYYAYLIEARVDQPWMPESRFQRLLRYMSAEDLVGRSVQARFAASYRLQVVQEWLRATGHKGLLVFIDEVDNVQRQIHGKGHPGCYRGLSWYCSWTGLAHVRTVFASTPEALEGMKGWYGDWIGERLVEQQMVLPEEVTVYRQWLRELRQMSEHGWLSCPKLTAAQRVELFQNIRRFHEQAWGIRQLLDDETLGELARHPQFTTTRRWVRASVQVLDLLQQHFSARRVENA
jgi:hypothetical protein